MKFLLDQGLARSTVSFLATMGLAAEHVGDLNLAKASDVTILGEGRARGSVVVTLDSDFHSLLAHSNAKSPSVIRIRIEGLKGEDVARIIQRVVEATIPLMTCEPSTCRWQGCSKRRLSRRAPYASCTPS